MSSEPPASSSPSLEITETTPVDFLSEVTDSIAETPPEPENSEELPETVLVKKPPEDPTPEPEKPEAIAAAEDEDPLASVPELPEPVEIPENLQVRLRSEDGKLILTLPPEAEASKVPTAFSWSEILHQFKQQLMGRERFWQPNAIVHLMAGDRLLDGRQLQAIADTLQDAQLLLKWVYTSRRQTAVVAATAGYSVEQITAVSPLMQPTTAPKVMDEPLYVQMTLRSGTEIRHGGTVVVLGDLNPGSSIVAEGDILVWGKLRGVAHAGSKGNARCLIMALQMEPTQIRIADFVARAPDAPPVHHPEVAYVSPQGNIRIARAADFQRPEWNNS
jgi:septum site-determining protein MinC